MLRPRNDPRWTVLIPIKPVQLAKQRLGLPTAARAALVTAMLRDVLAVVAELADPVLVSADPSWSRLGVAVLPDAGDGLSAALAAAAATVRGAGGTGADGPLAARSHAPVAALVADVPAIRATELAAALRAAAGVPRGVVADAAGTGTVLLTASGGHALAPAFGPGSHAAHTAAGAADLTAALAVPGLRRDVDTLADLQAALALGVGRHTAAAVPPCELHPHAAR